MARKPRMEVAPGVYHVFGRGNDRRRLFIDDVDRRRYLALLGAVTLHRRWRTMAYCLMENHVHLLIETMEPNLGAGMHRLHGGYAQSFNGRHDRTGHVFERRFGAVPVESEAQFHVVVAYIALNPVAAKLCATPEAWPWSSHAQLVGGGEWPRWLDVTRLLSYFAAMGGDPIDRYLRLIGDRGAGLRRDSGQNERGARSPGPLGVRAA